MRSKLQAILAYYLLKLSIEELAYSTKRSYASQARQFLLFIEERGGVSTDLAAHSFVLLAHQFLASGREVKAFSLSARAAAIKHFLNKTGIQCGTLERPKTALSTRAPLSHEELNAFLRAAEQAGSRDKAIGFILASTGIRLSECELLNQDSVLCGDGEMVLAVQRSGHQQQIPLQPETGRALAEYLEQSNITAQASDQPLFVDRNGNRMTARALTASVKKIGWMAKLSVTPALLRLTRLSQIAHTSRDPVTLAYLGGFNCLDSAKRLIKACEKDISAAHLQNWITNNR